MKNVVLALLAATAIAGVAQAADATKDKTDAPMMAASSKQPEKCQWVPLERGLRSAGADNAAVAEIQPVYDGLVSAGANEDDISSALSERFVTYIVPILANCSGATAAGPQAGATGTNVAPPSPPSGGNGGGGGCNPRVASCN